MDPSSVRTPTRQERTDRLTGLVHWFRDRVVASVALGVAAELGLALLFRNVGAGAQAGISVALCILPGLVVGLVNGAAAGCFVALAGSVAFLTLVINASSTRAVFFGVPLILVWVAIAALAGIVSDRQRGRTGEALALAAGAREDAEAARERAEWLVVRAIALQRMTASLAGAMTVREVAGAALGSGLDAVGAQGGVFGLIDEEAALIRVIQNRGYQDVAGPIEGTVPLESATALGDALSNGEAVFISSRDGCAEHHPGVAPVPPGQGFRSWTALPLVASGRPLGVLGLAFRQTRRFEREEREVLTAFASQCAQALERAQLYDAQRRVAEVLQRSLLPDRVSELPSVRAAARYVAGGPNVEVGGDWYDVVALPDGLLAVTIGDVAGRGTRAAAVMGHFRTALRAYALTYSDPGEAIRALARHLGVYEEVDLATLLYMTLDPMTGALRYATAGHPPALMREPDGSTRFLDAPPAPPLGAGDVGSYTSAEASLAEGACLVLYTDGLVERRGESLDEGLARLAEAVRAGPPAPDALCDHLIEALLGDAERADDVALIVLVREPVPARLHLELPARPSVLPRLRRDLRSWMARTDLAEDVASDVLLAISEAANNAIAHAYGVADGTFQVELALDGEDVVAEVRDEGTWRRRVPREGGAQPDGALSNTSPVIGLGGPGGRGIELIRGTMDDVRIDRTAAGTTVRMRRRVKVRT